MALDSHSILSLGLRKNYDRLASGDMQVINADIEIVYKEDISNRIITQPIFGWNIKLSREKQQLSPVQAPLLQGLGLSTGKQERKKKKGKRKMLHHGLGKRNLGH